jgi:3-isopropylmalate dehydratase small subunit
MAGQTAIEKILNAHSSQRVAPGEIVEIVLDSRAARDFGGANVVGHLEKRGLGLNAPGQTYFTFDCNPTGSDQKYAANQHSCRLFARRTGAQLFDIGSGIGTHLAVDEGLAWPGSTFVSTDSHANILGGIGAFGQGMGDIDIAAGFAHGKVWFRVPASRRLLLKGTGASGLLGYATEVEGDYVDELSLDGRLTIASMGTEMGAIVLLFKPNREVLDYCRAATGKEIEPIWADADASYDEPLEVDITDLAPMIARPGHPEDVVPVSEARGAPIDSAFVGSCTNGRWEDLVEVARILEDHRVAEGVVLKIVPATDAIWRRCLDEGLIATFKRAGALVASAGCAGCAEGQVGQNGPGERTVSTGNRNFKGKQGKGEVWLASPATVAASAVTGAIVTAADLGKPLEIKRATPDAPAPSAGADAVERGARPELVEGRLYIIDVDNIDTDMIFHNRHLAITDPAEMTKHAFGNLDGHQGFPGWVQPGDVVWVGANFGCGSSRQQAVDALLALGVGALIAPSYGAIYWRNAVNAGFPALTIAVRPEEVGAKTGDRVRLDLVSGAMELLDQNTKLQAEPMGEVPLSIYRRGGLLAADTEVAR